MYEQKGCFHGIDTYSLKSTGDFSYCDPILDENEALSISYRSDIVSLLSDLEMNNTLSKGSSNEMIRRASYMTKNIEAKKFCSGATFVSITDTMKLQQKVNTHNMISVETDSGTIIHTRRNWIQSIIFCQKCNSNGYGAQFPTLLPLISNTHKTQFLWILCRMLISVKELWDIIEEVPKKTLLWHGWILTYISKQCFNENRIQGISTCPFKTVYINSIDKVFTKMSSIGMCLDTVCGLQNMLSHIPNIRVVTQSEISSLHNIHIDTTVIIAINDEINCSNIINEADLHIMTNTYELRFFDITKKIENSDVKWEGLSYFRHGGEFKSWWKVERLKRLPIHSVFPVDVYGIDTNVMIYVKKYDVNIDDIRNTFLKYIGGQSHVYCKLHKLPLIVVPTSKNYCGLEISGQAHSHCKRKIYYGCPNIFCDVSICQKCFNQYSKSTVSFISNEMLTLYELSLKEDMMDINDNDSLQSENDDSTYSHFSNDDDDISISDENDTTLLDDDTCYDYVTTSNHDYVIDNEMPLDDINLIPTTTTGELAFNVEKDFSNQNEYIDGHVILNQCGSLLSRTDNHINGYRSQKHFLQRIASTISDKSIPLLYPEAMLFPSIF